MDESLKTLAAPEVDSDANFFEKLYKDPVGPPPDDSLAKITDLVDKARASSGLIDMWKLKIEAEKAVLKDLFEVSIPEAMHAVGMGEIGLADGTRVKVESFHRGAITERTKGAAHQWLLDNGFSGIIKRDVTVSFGRDDEGYDELLVSLREDGFTPKSKEGVHVQTLQAFIHNQAEKGEPVPQDLFNIYSGHTTKLIRQGKQAETDSWTFSTDGWRQTVQRQNEV